MIKIIIKNAIILFNLYEISLDNWMRISKYIIEKYGFEYWLAYSYFVRHKDELEEKEYQEACELLMKYI